MLGMTDADGLAITMLAMILLSFGVILTLFVCMARNASRRDAEVDRLLDEVEQDEKAGERVKVGSGEEKEREPWERDVDWWKAE